MHVRSVEAMVGPAASAARLRLLAGDLRTTAAVVGGVGTRPLGAAGQWQGPAADAHRQWSDRFIRACDGVTDAVMLAAQALDVAADATARSSGVVAELRSQLDMATVAADGVAVMAVWARYDQVMATQDRAEITATGAIAQTERALSGLRFTEPRVLGLTGQQWRDVGRGLGDAAWEAGPGAATWAQRWLTVPGLLGLYDPLDQAEDDARAWLDEAGGGRDDTATYDWAYGGVTVATIALPVPSGRARLAVKGAELAEGAVDAGRGADRLDGSIGGLRQAGESGGAGPTLSPRAQSAIAEYTDDGYWALNLALRSGSVAPGSPVAQRVDDLSKALSELPAYQGVAYRGTDLSAGQLNRYTPGEVVREPAFTSASRVVDGAFPGNAIFRIDSTTGRDVSSYSTIAMEAEVLFDHRTVFEVTRRHVDDNGVTVIYMRDLGQ